MQDTYNQVRNAFSDRQQRERENALADRQNALSRAAGGMLAGGDATGARDALWKGGELDAGYKVDADSQAQHRREAEGLARFTDGVSRMMEAGHDPKAAWAAGLQYAPQLGIDPADVQRATPLFEQDPKGFLTFARDKAKQELEIVNRGNGGYDVVDKSTGANVRSVPPSAKEAPPHWVERKKADGSTEWVDLNERAAPDAQGQGGTPPGADQTWQSMIQRESGGRPGVIGPQTRYGRPQGMTQMLPQTAQAMAKKLGAQWRPDLMTGTSPEAAAYQQQLGRAYFDEGLQKYGGDTSKAAMYYHGGPNEAIWGPKTRAYADAVAPNALTGSGGRDGLRRVVPGSEAKPGESGAVDPNIVKGLIEGRITPPTQKAASTPYWQAQLQAATAQDPTFDGVNFQARAKTRSDFTSGKSAVNITALNTVVGHLDSLDRSIDNLGNYGLRMNNQAAHAIAQATGTDARIRDFETKKEAVANELTRVFRGTGGAEADIQAWKKQLDSANSAPSLHTVVQSMAELINSRLEALGEQYRQGMGTTKDPLTLLTPDKQKAFKRLQGGQPASRRAGSADGWSVKRLR